MVQEEVFERSDIISASVGLSDRRPLPLLLGPGEFYPMLSL